MQNMFGVSPVFKATKQQWNSDHENVRIRLRLWCVEFLFPFFNCCLVIVNDYVCVCLCCVHDLYSPHSCWYLPVHLRRRRTRSRLRYVSFLDDFMQESYCCISSYRILADSSELWKKICRTAKDNGQLGDTLVLRCENHPDQEIKITTAKVRNMTDTGCCLLQRRYTWHSTRQFGWIICLISVVD